jgi:hypothetical protein
MSRGRTNLFPGSHDGRGGGAGVDSGGNGAASRSRPVAATASARCGAVGTVAEDAVAAVAIGDGRSECCAAV